MANREVIVDSNVLMAYFHTEDAHHRRAVGELKKYQSSRIILTEYVLLEVSTLLKQKIGTSRAQTIISTLLQTEQVEVLPSSQYFSGTLQTFLTSTDKHLSFVDTSLLVLSTDFLVITLDKKLASAIRRQQR